MPAESSISNPSTACPGCEFTRTPEATRWQPADATSNLSRALGAIRAHVRPDAVSEAAWSTAQDRLIDWVKTKLGEDHAFFKDLMTNPVFSCHTWHSPKNTLIVLSPWGLLSHPKAPPTPYYHDVSASVDFANPNRIRLLKDIFHIAPHARPPNQPTGNSSAAASHPREAKRTARKINVGEINAATLQVLKSGRASDASWLLDEPPSSPPSPRPSLDSAAYPVPVVSTIRHDDPRHRLTPRTVSSSGPLPDIIWEHSAGGDRGQSTAVPDGGKATQVRRVPPHPATDHLDARNAPWPMSHRPQFAGDGDRKEQDTSHPRTMANASTSPSNITTQAGVVSTLSPLATEFVPKQSLAPQSDL